MNNFNNKFVKIGVIGFTVAFMVIIIAKSFFPSAVNLLPTALPFLVLVLIGLTSNKKTFIILFTISFNAMAQEPCNDCPKFEKGKNKGTFYFAWGYNRGYYSNSDIHLQNTQSDTYDFTLYNLTAQDRPTTNIFRADISIPQYLWRLGYYFNDKYDLGIEINFDHTKYVVDDFQKARLKGTIRGIYYDKDTLLTPNFFHFEHTDGANFLLINLLKRQKLFTSKNNKHLLSAVGKVGIGLVIPRTDVTLFGKQINNDFNIAGYVTGLDLGFRYEFFKYFFVESSVKGAFAHYIDALAIDTGRANHSFWSFELLATGGFQFPL